MKSIRIHVVGKVQGVYFRQSTAQFCNQNGIKGQVKNLHDGSVEILATATAQLLAQLIVWSKVGPSKAVVERVDIEEIPGIYFPDFRILR